jgi:hypothetical protein
MQKGSTMCDWVRLSHPALGWLKVVCDVNELDRQNWIYYVFPFPYMAIDWRFGTSVW